MNFLKAIRRFKGITQTQLANALGVSLPVVSRWELGVTTPSYSSLKMIGKAMGIPIEKLINDAGLKNIVDGVDLEAKIA